MANNVTALAPINAQTALEPQTVQEAFWLSERLVKSGLLGELQRPEAAFAVILAGRELGLTAMQSLRSIHIIKGRPTLSADLMAALVKKSPLCRYFKLVSSTAQAATYATERVSEGETRLTFTIEQAKAAGLVGKGTWQAFPDAMLRARCIAALARAVFPDLLMGVYEPDELAARGEAAPAGAPLPVVVDAVAVDVEPTPVEQTDEEKIAAWTARIEQASTLAALEAVGAEVRALPKSEACKMALSAAYIARKKLLKMPIKPVVREIVEEG